MFCNLLPKHLIKSKNFNRKILKLPMPFSAIFLLLLPGIGFCLYEKILGPINYARNYYFLHKNEPFAIFEYEWLMETRLLNLISNDVTDAKMNLLRKTLFSISCEKQ